MRVLVTGATGFLGGWVVRELLAEGHSVRALIRDASKLDNLRELLESETGMAPPNAIECAIGDILSADSVKQALSDCDAVLHCAGISHLRDLDKKQLFDVNYQSVEVVLGSALAVGIKRAVLCSATGAMGGSDTPQILDETSPSTAEHFAVDYFVSKLRGEQAALRLYARGLPVTIVRPSYVLGPGDIYRSSAYAMLSFARRQIPLYIEGGLSITDVRDVARGQVAALLRGRPGEIYILGGHNLKTSELMELFFRTTGVKPPPRVPYTLAFVLAGGMELAARALGQGIELSTEFTRAAHLYNFVSSEKAKEELGYSFRSASESLRDTFRYFMRIGRLQPVTPELRQLALTDDA